MRQFKPGTGSAGKVTMMVSVILFAGSVTSAASNLALLLTILKKNGE